MRFLADMGISQGVVDWLCAEGHDAKHLGTEGLQRMPDDQIFAKAGNENRIVLTFDLDFGEIVALLGRQQTSVILFRLHNTRTANVIKRLQRVLEESEKPLAEGAIVVVEDSRHRVRLLPIGRKESKSE
jgi:predicted nuclease of predicted toxin-antitoxin system